MTTIFTSAHFAWLLSALFAGTGALHVVGFPPALRQAYARWHYPSGFRKVTGSLLLVAAACLLVPAVHLVGIAIAALVLFLAATTFLNRGQYGFAAPAIALLFALIPASLSGSV